MKYIKTYEQSNEKPQVGDYVILNIFHRQFGYNKNEIIYEEYMRKQIGQIVELPEYDTKFFGGVVKIKIYLTKKIIRTSFSSKRNKSLLKTDEYGNKYIIFTSLVNKIAEFAKSKEELEMKIAAKQFNI